jgi:hypothetical protein
LRRYEVFHLAVTHKNRVGNRVVRGSVRTVSRFLVGHHAQITVHKLSVTVKLGPLSSACCMNTSCLSLDTGKVCIDLAKQLLGVVWILLWSVQLHVKRTYRLHNRFLQATSAVYHQLQIV